MTRYIVELSDEQARDFAAVFNEELRRHGTSSPYNQAGLALADAIRTNPPKPPRMDEPLDGDLVVALAPGRQVRSECVRYPGNGRWYVLGQTGSYRWDELVDPEPYS